jgi:hypothetical protein
MRIINKKYKLIFSRFFWGVILLLTTTYSISALEFKDQLSPGLELKYRHWNEKKQKITGYTVIKHKIINGEIVVMSENINKKDKVYSSKQLWFNIEKGQLIKYEETDYRTGLSVKDLFFENNIKSYVKQKSEEKTFNIKLTDRLIPFEVIDLSLQKKVVDIINNKKIALTLYLPLIAFELDAYHLPIALSKLEVVAKFKKIETQKTLLGRKQCVWISVEPTSFFVKTLLPAEKTTFSFTFLAESPGYLLELIQGDVKLQLDSVVMN